MRYLILVTAALALAACHQRSGEASRHESHAADTLSYKIHTLHQTPAACDTLPDSLCKAYVTITYPVFKDQRMNNFVSEQISVVPMDSVPMNSPESAAEQFLQDYDAYHQEFPEAVAGYEWEENLSVAHQDPQLITFILSDYEYTAGAHGITLIRYMNLDKDQRKLLTLSDLLVKGYQTELTRVGEALFREQEQLAPQDNYDRYFFEHGEFSLPDNFLITSRGLRFLYNPYEIKPFAEGTTELVIPYSRINSLIRADAYLAKYKQ